MLFKKRKFMAVLGIAVSTTLVASCSGNAEPNTDGLKSLKVSVGRQPEAGGNSPLTQYMIENELFEKAAEEYGYDLEVEWRDYPNAPPMVEAMAADRLDFGMWGNTPVIQALKKEQPYSLVAVGEGHLRFVLATRSGSGISNLDDVAGKRIGVTIGADPHMVFLQMIKSHFDTANVEDLDIELINMPSQAASAEVPNGVDATIAIYPAYLAQHARDDDVIAIANSFGETEEGYDGPEGSGAGLELEAAADSLFAPEGFYAHRSIWVQRNKLIETDPDITTAFTEALQVGLTEMAEMSDEDIAGLVTEYWGDDLELGGKIVADELLFERQWAWITNGDAQAIVKLSQALAEADVIDDPLSWDQALEGLKLPIEALEKAYTAGGSFPSSSGFEENSSTVQGPPQWELDQWESPDGE